MHETSGIDSRYWGYSWDDSNNRSPTALGCANKVLTSQFYHTDSDQLCIAHFQDQQHITHHHHYTDNNAHSASELSSPNNSGVYNPAGEEDKVSLHSPTSTAGSDSFQHHLMMAAVTRTADYNSAAKPKRLCNHPIFLLQKVSFLDESYHSNENRSEMDYGSKCSPHILSTNNKCSGKEVLIPSENVDISGTIKIRVSDKTMDENYLIEQERCELPESVHRKQRAWTSWLRLLVCGLSNE